MNLFSRPKPQASTPPPDYDEARQKVDENLRARRMRGRAAAMLSDGGTAPTAMRQVTGN